MTQYVINIGAIPNDGTGDPLRTAFNETNLNFNQVFAAGPVLSNIQIANNKILTTNTNGNLVLAPNGTGVIQANVSIVPNLANLRNLGSSTQRWATIYTQYLNVSTGTSINGDLSVAGNLIVQGNIIPVGNIVTDSLTIQLANTATTANAANGAGITVGLNDDIATLLYNSASNVWAMNIGLATPNIVVNNISSDDSTFVSVQDGLDVQGDITAETLSVAGNITGNYFIGNGSQLTGIASSYGNSNVATLVASFGSNTISTTGNITAGYFIGNGSQLTGITSYANANAVAYGESGWAGNIIPSGNAVYSLGNATNQWNDLYVSNSTIFMNNVPISLGAGNVLTVNGEALLSNDSNTSISTTGNISADYFIGNGSLLTGISSTGDITFDGANISAPDDTVIRIQAKDSDSVVRSLFRLDPDNGYAEMRALSNQRNTEFTTGDWATGVWTGTENNAQLAFTGATDIVNFLNNEFSGSTNQTISVNGGEPMVYNGWSGGGSDVTFFVDVAPPVDPTTITSIEFGYYYQSRIEIDNDDDEINIRGQGLNININSDESVDIGAANSVEIVSDTIVSLLNNSATNPIIIRTNNGNTNQTWEFGANGDLTVPGDIQASVDNGLIIETSTTAGGNTFLELATDYLDLYVSNPAGAQNSIVEIYLNNTDELTPSATIAVRGGDGSDVNQTWEFDQTGNLTLPAGGVVYETNIPGGTFTGSTIALKPQGGIDADQQLLIYPTAANVDANHLHLTSGNLYNTELFLGDDNLYVKLANTGNVVINSNDAVGNSAQWTFNNFGTLTLPGGSQIRPLGANLDIIAGTGSYVNLITADESSSVGVDNGGGYITTAGGTWDFGITGNLTAPGNISAVGNVTAGNLIATGNIVLTGSLVGSGASPAPSLSGFSSVSAITVSATGNISAAGNVSAGNISAVGNIVGGNLTVGSGTITGGNVNGANFNGNVAFGTGTVGGSGNITGGNILTAGIVSATGNVSGNFFIGNGSQLTGIAASYGNADVATFLAAYGSNTISTTGNITAGNLISSATIYGNVDVVLGNIANAAGTKTRMVTDTTFSYIQTGNGTIGSTGNIVFSPYSSPTQQVVIDTASGNLSAAGNVTAQNFIGNISITGNVIGTQPNVTLVAGAYDWTFDNTGNLTLPGNTFAVNYANNTPVDVVTRFEGSWNVATGNTTQSFTVDGNNTYQMWVEGNIPNGIIAWNATVTITNTNVPVLGQQFAWNYEGGGNILMFTSIPAQIIGTAGAISNVEPAVSNVNTFTFGINNASGNVAAVRYGWIQIS